MSDARPRVGRALLALGVCLAFASVAAAQTGEPAASPAPAAAPAPDAAKPAPAAAPAPPTPAAIPAAEIATRVESAQLRLVEARAAVQPDPAIVEIQKDAFESEQRFHDRVLEAAARLRGEPSLEDIEDIQFRARAANRQLESWQKTLSARSLALEKLRADLTHQREVWKLTIEAARADRVPAELIERAKGVRDEIRAIERELSERFDAGLKLQGLVAEESMAVAVLLQDVRRARFASRGRLFERNRAPLFTAFAEVEAIGSVLDRVRDGLDRDAHVLRDFAALEGGRRLIVHGLIFLTLLLIAFRMKFWFAARRRAGKTLGPSEKVFDYPISIAMLFTVLATPWVHPFLPRSYQAAVGLLLIVPILVLLPNVLAPAYRAVWYSFAALFVLDRIRSVFQPVELVERSLFVIETGGAAAIAVWLLRGERYQGLVASRWQRPFRTGLRVGLAMLVASVVANLAGFVSLSSLLGQGVLRSVSVGIVVYAAVSILRPLLAGLLRTRVAKSIRLLQGRRDAIETWSGRLIAWGAGLWWLSRTLDAFSLGDPLRDALVSAITSPLPLGEISFSPGDILLFLATAAAGVLLSRIVRAALEEDVFPRTRLARGVPHAISATARYAILIGAFLLAAAAAGFDWSRITLLAGAFGVGIGFGLQNIVNNFISGLILLYERPIQAGDTVEVGSLIGEVKRIGIRSSSVRTWQGAEVIVPNANLISEQVVNWTLSDRTRRIEIPVGVAYGSDPEAVLSLLEQVAATHAEVMTEPPPLALFQGFGDSSLDFELRVWTASFDRFARIRSEVAVAVHRALKQAAIEIPFPQRDVHIKVERDRES